MEGVVDIFYDPSLIDIPAIPDLDDILEEDMTAQMAAPPRCVCVCACVCECAVCV